MIQVAQKELCRSNVSMLCYKTSGKHLRVHYLVMDALGRLLSTQEVRVAPGFAL